MASQEEKCELEVVDNLNKASADYMILNHVEDGEVTPEEFSEAERIKTEAVKAAAACKNYDVSVTFGVSQVGILTSDKTAVILTPVYGIVTTPKAGKGI